MALSPLAVLDLRRNVAEIYRDVRNAPDAAAAHHASASAHRGLLQRHPTSPVPRTTPDIFAGVQVAAYDPAYRFVAPVVHGRGVRTP